MLWMCITKSSEIKDKCNTGSMYDSLCCLLYLPTQFWTGQDRFPRSKLKTMCFVSFSSNHDCKKI